MKKTSAIVCLTALMFLSGASLASAQTATTTPSATLTALLAQIEILKTQLETLKAAQQKVNETAQGLQGTFELIRELRQGMTSDDVTALQALLASDPTIYPEGRITGYYGALTAKAVKRFQKKHGLDQVGNVGPKTLKKLKELLKEHPIALHDDDDADDGDDNDGDDNKGKGHEKRPCAIVPPGHLIAPGWLKKHQGDDKPIVPLCQTLPPGIVKKLGTTTPPTATTTPPTADTTAPVITALSSTGITSTAATVLWTTDEASGSKVLYSTTNPVPADGTASTVGNVSLVTSHSMALSGLTSLSTYYYLVTSSDAAGNTATSSQGTFTTLATPDTTAPVITAVTSTAIASTTATVTWTTDESATGKVYYSTTNPVPAIGTASMAEHTTFMTANYVDLSGLTASSTYYYLVTASDAVGNTATSSQNSFATLMP
ncbi:MAG: peptidoglycan-binding protein [bacterium]|nr:peptidoglycan-binding protein [bacterium]